MFYNMIKSIISIKAIPCELNGATIEMTPVDLCARAIVALARTKESNKKIFHLFNYKKVEIGTLMHFINEMGYPVTSMEREGFLAYVKNQELQGEKASLFLVNDYNFEKVADEKYNVNISADITNKYLEALDFMWNDIDKEYISKIIKHIEEVKFIA